MPDYRGHCPSLCALDLVDFEAQGPVPRHQTCQVLVKSYSYWMIVNELTQHGVERKIQTNVSSEPLLEVSQISIQFGQSDLRKLNLGREVQDQCQ